MKPDEIRPRPCAGSLADQVRALACEDKDPATGRVLGVRSTRELVAWCKDLASELEISRGREYTHADLTEEIEGMDRTLAAARARIAELESTCRRQAEYAEGDEINAEHERQCRHLAEAAQLKAEAQLVDLLALELELVRGLTRSGLLPEGSPPPPTMELVALIRRMG